MSSLILAKDEIVVKVTLHEVAQEAGVSDSTVSRALRGLDKVDEGTRERVRQVADRLHYSISRNASSLASGKTMRVSVLFADKLNTWFDSSVLQGAYEVLSREKYDVIPSTVSTHEELQSFFDRLPADKNVDAVMVTSINLEPQQVKILQQLTIPTVGLDSRTIDGFDASVLLNDRKGMHEAVGLLKRFGHRRITFVGQPAPGDFKFSSQLRGAAFVHETRLAGYSNEEVKRLEAGQLADYRTYDEAVKAVVAKILSLDPMPTALCVETDNFAVSLMAALRQYGIRIPEDLSVIGFDDANIAVAANLTTVHQNPEEMSRLAARKTLALLHGKNLEERHTMFEPMLRLRDSTGYCREGS